MVSRLLEKLRQVEASQTRLIYPYELPSIMRKHIITGAMGSVYFYLIAGMFLVAFGSSLGLQQWQWALLSAGASLVLVFQLGSAFLVGRTGNRRHLWFTTSLTGRLLRGAGIAVAFFLSVSAPSGARLAFVLILVLASFFDAVCAPPWLSWLTDIIPKEQHGHFMGRRSAWASLANVCMVVPLGFLLDRIPEGPSKQVALLGVFALALAFGLADLFIHRTIPVPPMQLAPKRQFWHEVLVPLRDPRFQPWLAFAILWTFGGTLGGALAMVYFVENLGISHNLFGGSVVLIVLPLLSTIATGKYFGIMIDRYGINRTMRLGYRLCAVTPVFWLLATPATAMWWLAAAALIGGVGSTAAMTAATKLTTRLPEREHVAMYNAVSACVNSLAAAAGAGAAGLVLRLTQHHTWTLGGVHIIGFHALFIASVVICGASLALIRRIPEPGTAAVPATATANV
jgi:MFS family permease